MGFKLKLHYFFLVILEYRGISSFQAGQLFLSPLLPVLGDGDFTLQCTFTLSSSAEQLLGLTFRRKRTGDIDFSDILTIAPPTLPAVPTYNDQSLEARTVVTRPDTSLSTSVSVAFNSTQCSDIGEYKLVIDYYSGGSLNTERTAEVKVKVHGTFEGVGYGITGASPGYDVTENSTVTVTCKADVGAEPQGQLEWYYYKAVTTGTAYPISNFSRKGDLETVRECSHSQVSTLTLQMTEELNNIVIRCTLQQDVSTADGDDHKQTQSIFNVSYSSRRTTISPNPLSPSYSEGEQLTLTCSSAGNPPPSYTWLLPNDQEVADATYQIQSLRLNDSGYYTCVAKNGVPDENYRDTNTVFLYVVTKETMTTVSNSEKTSTACSPCVTATHQGGESNTVEASTLGAIIGVMGAIIIAQGIVVAFMVIRQKKCVQCRADATFETPDKNLQGSVERSYDTLDRPYDGYELPSRQTTST